VLLARRLPPGLLRDLASFVPQCVTTVRRLRREPRVPRRAKIVAALAGLWLLSPIDLLPESLPVIGPLDDVVVVALALRFAARRVPREVLLEAWPGEPRLLERLLGRPTSCRPAARTRPKAMNLAGSDAQRTRFRRPLGLLIIAYKAVLGLSEIVVGALLMVPGFDPQATFARLSADELRKDPGDRFVAWSVATCRRWCITAARSRSGWSCWGWPSWSQRPPCGRARSGAATCWLRPWRCCFPSTSARPSPFPAPAMSCWPPRTPPCWSYWCCCVGGCQADHSGPEPNVRSREPPWLWPLNVLKA
jgi:uncharacterized membrane protein YkvA (DUF1232 family)